MRPVVPTALVLAALAACAREPAPAATPELDTMDERKPVPLLPMMAHHQKQNMRDHLVAVEEIVGALATDDFAAMERAAGRIGFSEKMGQMCTHMGAGAPGFTERALAFHHTADEIAVAASARDRTAVTKALDATLKACTACHAAYKQQIVDQATWQKLTASAAPAAGKGH